MPPTSAPRPQQVGSRTGSHPLAHPRRRQPTPCNVLRNHNAAPAQPDSQVNNLGDASTSPEPAAEGAAATDYNSSSTEDSEDGSQGSSPPVSSSSSSGQSKNGSRHSASILSSIWPSYGHDWMLPAATYSEVSVPPPSSPTPSSTSMPTPAAARPPSQPLSGSPSLATEQLPPKKVEQQLVALSRAQRGLDASRPSTPNAPSSSGSSGNLQGDGVQSELYTSTPSASYTPNKFTSIGSSNQNQGNGSSVGGVYHDPMRGTAQPGGGAEQAAVSPSSAGAQKRDAKNKKRGGPRMGSSRVDTAWRLHRPYGSGGPTAAEVEAEREAMVEVRVDGNGTVCLELGVGVCEGGTGLGVGMGIGACFVHASGALELCVWMWVWVCAKVGRVWVYGL